MFICLNLIGIDEDVQKTYCVHWPSCFILDLEMDLEKEQLVRCNIS